MPSAAFPTWWGALQAGQPVVIERTDEPGDVTDVERAFLANGAARSLALVPMRRRGETTGFVGMAALWEERSWSPAVLGLLEQFGTLVTTQLAHLDAEHERQRSESALRASEERFRRLVQNSPDTVRTRPTRSS
jgi:GAF domain-containing protein